jgi:hypothetical protein
MEVIAWADERIGVKCKPHSIVWLARRGIAFLAIGLLYNPLHMRCNDGVE